MAKKFQPGEKQPNDDKCETAAPSSAGDEAVCFGEE